MVKSMKKETPQVAPGLRTMEGVYVPTLLTILGVIMYLRLGWVVGNAGLLGALAIIGIAHLITLATTLSMSSMLTNIKVGSGGAYSIVSQSLGLEMGGAIGIPLYFSQSISVAFYITGFTELWLTFFPHHPINLIAFVTWAVLAGLSMYSTKLAFRVQYLILAAVVLSIISFLAGPDLADGPAQMVGTFQRASFWQTFAIFFPAVTGILTGATMSGELADPRKSIIRGTLGAVITGLIVYSGIAVLFANRATVEVLLSGGMVILDLSFSRVLIVLGVMGAVLSSALSTLVSAPRTLAALAENRSVPFYGLLARKDRSGAPRNAIIISSLVSVIVLMAGNLDALASLLTLFFLTTYAMINLVVFLEQIIGITSFRPSLSVSVAVPLVGLIGCVFAMFLINKLFVIVTIIVISGIYYMLQRKSIVSSSGDVRGGVLYAIAEWAAQKAVELPYHPKLWKPSIIIPVETPDDFRRITFFIDSLIAPSGRVYYLTINDNNCTDESRSNAKEALKPLKEKGLFTQQIIIEEGSFDTSLGVVLQSLSSTFLAPNSIFFTLSDDEEKQKRFRRIIDQMHHTNMGLLCLHIHPKYNFGQTRKIHLWLRDRSPNNDLAVLSALQLSKNWNASVHLCRVAENTKQSKKAENELYRLIEDARLPVTTQVNVFTGSFEEAIQGITTDIHILGMPADANGVKYDTMIGLMNTLPSSVLFVADSGLESALV